MLVPLSFSLALAGCAAFYRTNARDEIVKLTATAVMVVCLFLSVAFAPLLIKLLVLAVPFVGGKLPTLRFLQR